MPPIDQPQSTSAPAPGKSIMPPYTVLRYFLDENAVAGLLDHALSRQAEFAPTKVGKRAVDPAIRVSLGLRDLGPYARLLEDRLLALLPKLVADLRVTEVDDPKLELQLVAHGDGAFFKRHIDTQTANDEDKKRIRMLSGVYYFNTEPRAFSGGALRLYAIGGESQQNFVDIEPERNSFVVFPSWAPHEVMPVICPSKRFVDSRFAVNCWIHRKKADPSAA